MNKDELAQRIEHSCLRPEARARDIEQLCRDACEHGFWGVCVHTSRVVQAVHLLEETSVKVVATIGFPLGAVDGDVKRFETEVAVDCGAQEFDVVLNVGRLKDGDDRTVLRELRDVVEAADERMVKVILETGLLSREEKVRGCNLAMEAGAQFVKTSTGFGRGKATVEDVRLLKEIVGDRRGVKASGGIRDTDTALALIEAGAARLGTSCGPEIMRVFLP